MGEKEMTLESEKIRAIPMVHWCQWRPFLSPLTPVESICEYWTTLVQATCKSCYGTIQIIRKLKNWLRKHGVTTHWYWSVYWTCVPCTCSPQSRCWWKWTPRSLLTFTYSNVLSEIVIAGWLLCKLCTCDIWLVDSNIGIYTVHSSMQFFKETFFCCRSKYNFEATVADENAVTEVTYKRYTGFSILIGW